MFEAQDTRVLGTPKKLFHPERILIMKMLSVHGTVDFRELRQALSITDGNLASHLRTLEQEGYVTVHKEFEGKRPRTSYELTAAGRQTFNLFLEAMKAVVA
jgi:DNA-binding HxlR family transcriptional regulator